MLYFFLSIVLLDFLRLLNWQFHFFPAFVKEDYEKAKEITALIVLIISSLVILFGYLNTRNIKVKTLTLNIERGSSSLTELNAVLAADIHLSPMDNELLLSKIVNKINELKPDVVFFAGDIVDDKGYILHKNNIGESFLRLKPKYGIYAVTGNHEFISGIKDAEKYIEDFKINLLRDSSVKIEDGFIIAGRDDRSGKSFTGKERLPLDKILEGTDRRYPVILMDHTPFGLEEAEKNNIALQLSGHVHNGQLYPLNYITGLIYEKSWGYLKKEKTHYYITCGAGTWGPPVRTGSFTEIVHLKLKFVHKI
jgi:predicted MPP superfamily phosphohydrolase